MEQLYAFGISCIQFVQYWFKDWGEYFELVNHISNPHHVTEILFPLVSIVDSVFASQLLLCMAFGGWLNAVMKWWLLEDRPYWWVRETTYYNDGNRPMLRQTMQTCETGPGCPSGHSMTASMMLLLLLMWISHVMQDRQSYIWWWKHMVYPVSGVALASVILARLFVAAHFPHQCLIGAFVGAFLAPALCIYVSDPYIWRYGYFTDYATNKAIWWHVSSAAITVLIAVLTYFSLVLVGMDPQWTVKLAFKWCENPNSIRVSSTPLFSLVYSTASLFGWALSVTPAVAEYRHYTKNRSLVLAAFSAILIHYYYQHFQETMPKDNAYVYYVLQFFLVALKTVLLIRLTPKLATWPYTGYYNNSKNKLD